ncbi:MAG: hypothetical protein M2R45_01031 [Verrucomicrobia subdivision 3 bacterium]|nr:hypothetical protein [Limisphaerales bacterium]MCS1414143.1 hypothetical protein [Limisphaerales bacterium]
MSTADSCLSTLSSMDTKDIYHPYLNPLASEAQLTCLGKYCSSFIVTPHRKPRRLPEQPRSKSQR